ncbi:uncharacterized protein LOC126985841 [Eriocheir sinensis]|uniref:uncharacterized protein LOC126985841 n=1 Tax=Eriocheir sinensis TaxID=95602 RepID=UPI0021C79B00|nr:uncharacterized protein LOC126985841 [Eriocheir sinensis]
MGEETKYCENCKKEVSTTNFTVHTVHCHRNIAICPLCKEPVPRSTYQDHLQSEHKEVRCPKCGVEMEPVRIYTHEKNECPKRLIACKHCELEVTASELQKHIEYCEARTERCKGCTKYVQVKHLQFHYANDHRYLRPEDKAGRSGSDDEGSEECPICLGPFTLPLALECGHTFCMVCVKGIANTTKNCAICRRDIPRDMLMDVRFCREEDIIKNYVNKPRKKNTRSHSVPNRSSSSPSTYTTTTTTTPTRRLVHHTTQDYDDMVNALLSSRTSSTSYRYQRPANTHTPPSYTPYSTSTTSSTTTTTTSSSSSCQDSCQDSCKPEKESNTNDDCCCSSSSSSSSHSTPSSSPSSSSSSSTTTTTTTASTRPITTTRSSSSTSTSSPSSSTPRTTTTTTARTTTASTRPQTSTSPSSSSSSSSSTSSSTSSSPNGARPRRPTSLALETMATLSSLSNATSPSRDEENKRTRPPRNATQEQYDRWLAFQLAKAEDDLPAEEFNRKHRPTTFKRSQSMPERPETSSSSESDSEDSDGPSSSTRRSTRRPPASPRHPASSSSSSSASSSSSTTPISKSSSDSNATSSGSSVLSTGARPKNTRLKKRVSFREETTPVRREAPVLLPCEFCDEMFPERDLMRHQTSCEKNETQLPRASRLTPRPTPVGSPTTFSPSSSTSFIPSSSSSSSSSVVSPSSSTTFSPRTPAAPAAPATQATPTSRPALTSTPRRTPARTESRESPAPAPAPRRSPPLSPPPTSATPPPATITIVDRPPQPPSVVVSAANARPFSESPAPSASTSSASVCTSPSTSSSASPVPAPASAPPDTPTTDAELDLEEDTPYMRPRRGRLLSSAIFSWRSISATGAASRRGYVRSNTAPLEDTGVDEDEDAAAPPVLTSMSATQLPPTSKSPEPAASPAPTRRHAPSPPPATSPTARRKAPSPPRPQPPASPPQPQEQQRPESVFIKNPNKYRAPPPPQPQTQPQTQPQPQTKPTEAQPQTTQPQQTQTKPQVPPPPPQQQQQQQQQERTKHTSISSSTTSLASITSSRKAAAPQPPTQKQGEVKVEGKVEGKSESKQVNGFRFDSQPMMKGVVEDGIPCEFCSKVLPRSKFQSHQNMCEATTRPPTLRPTSPGPAEKTNRPAPPVDKPEKARSPIPARHKKGPAPPPPPVEEPRERETSKSKESSKSTKESSKSTKESKSTKNDERAKRESSPLRNRMERSHSVMDERVCYSEKVRLNRHLTRTNSIKESSSRGSLYKEAAQRAQRSYYSPSPSLSRRWSSREVVHGNNIDSSSSFSTNCWSGSSSNLYTGSSYTSSTPYSSSGYSAGHGWSGAGSHFLLRDDVRSGSSSGVRYTGSSSASCSAAAAAAAAAASSSSYYGGLRYRERSVSRARPASLYTTSDTWGSLMDFHSPTRQFNITDTFSSASLAYKPTKRPSKKYRAPQPPCRST